MGVSEIMFMHFPDLALDRIPHRLLTESIRKVIDACRPYEVYTPHPGDLHTDHKALTAAVLVALRPKYHHIPEAAYTYETLSETGLDYQNPQNPFSPNVYVDISSTIDKKIRALELHESQVEEYPHSRSTKAVKALSLYRGTQAGMVSAEGFSLIRRYER